jgi:HD-like signal output (HDOD) protein
MTEALSKKIDSLPPLPKTIIDLEEFKRSPQKDLEVLEDIISHDPLIVATLLKVSNSAMFGFNNKVETASRAIHLLGVNFTLSIAFGSAIKNALDTDLGAYGINADQFMSLANTSSNLLKEWLKKVDNNLKEELLLPVFLLETGRFVLSGLAIEDGFRDEFLRKIRANPLDISNIEKEYFNVTTPQVTSSIFSHWNLSESLIEMIKYADNVENCPAKYKKDAQILDVVRTVCNVSDPLADQFAEAGIAKAKAYGLDTKNLEKAIEIMQDRLLEE